MRILPTQQCIYQPQLHAWLFDRPHIFLLISPTPSFHFQRVTDTVVKKGEEEKLRCSLEVVEDCETVNHGGRLEGWHCLRWTGFSPHLTWKTAQMTALTSQNWTAVGKEADKWQSVKSWFIHQNLLSLYRHPDCYRISTEVIWSKSNDFI